MILIFIGPPYSGKGTHAKMLGNKLNLPVFSMGALIREAYAKKDQIIIKAYKDYAMKGKHLPTKLKFPLLEEKMNENKKGFILDNFPATSEDLNLFLNYLLENNLKIDKVFYLKLSIDKMRKRIFNRGRKDDDIDIIMQRRKIQDQQRLPVIEYFKKQNVLTEVDTDKDIKKVEDIIESSL